MAGRLLVGTSGFAYPAWSPRFYPAGVRGGELLRYYGTQLDAVELNNTFYRQPRPEQVATWLAATPDDFRFVVKAQRSGSGRFFGDPTSGLDWLTDPYRAFGERLGAVLFRLPDIAKRDDDKLRRFLGAWPRDLPLVVELREPSWDVDETYRALATPTRRCASRRCRRTRYRPRCGAPRSVSTCGCAATITRPPSSRRGATGCDRSSMPATTCSCSSATTRWAVARSWPSSSGDLAETRRPA